MRCQGLVSETWSSRATDESSVLTMSDLDILNQTLAVEHIGIAAYDAALGTGLLGGPTADAARAFRSDHVRHGELIVEQIVARGGTPVSPRDPADYAKGVPPSEHRGRHRCLRNRARGPRHPVL